MTLRFIANVRFEGWLRASISVGLIVCVAFLSGCAEERHNAKLAEDGVLQFHSQIDAEQYAAIYQAADAHMKSRTSEPDFVRLLQTIHRTLGSAQKSVLNHITFELAQGTILLVYNTTFTQGSAREHFRWQVKDGEPALDSYQIKSKQLPNN